MLREMKARETPDPDDGNYNQVELYDDDDDEEEEDFEASKWYEDSERKEYSESDEEGAVARAWQGVSSVVDNMRSSMNWLLASMQDLTSDEEALQTIAERTAAKGEEVVSWILGMPSSAERSEEKIEKKEDEKVQERNEEQQEEKKKTKIEKRG